MTCRFTRPVCPVPPNPPAPPASMQRGVSIQQLRREHLTRFLRVRVPKLTRQFFRWARARGIVRADAQDALQTILSRLAQRVGQNRATPELLSAAWVFRCAMRQAVRNHRMSATVQAHEPQAERVPGMWERHHQALRQDQLAALSLALHQVSERDRVLLTRYYFDGRTEAQIADEFGVAQGTISRALAGARARLRRAAIFALISAGYDRDELP